MIRTSGQESLARSDPARVPSVAGTPRRWLRLEGLAALVAGAGAYLALGGALIWLVPLILAVDLSMIGYVAGPRLGSVVYNTVHNWALAVVLVGAGWALSSTPLVLLGVVVLAHVGMDRLAGYGLKYPTAFGDTHLGRIGR